MMTEHLLQYGGWYLFAAVLLVLLIRWTWRTAVPRRLDGTRHAGRIGWGVRAAEELLADEGYRVLEVMRPATLHGQIDGRPYTLTRRVDLIAERRGRRFAVAVIGLDHAVSASDAATNPSPDVLRMLIEVALVAPCDGVLLAHVGAHRLTTFRFEFDPAAFVGTQRVCRSERQRDGHWHWNHATIASLREAYANSASPTERAGLAAQLRGLGEPIRA